MGQLRRGGNTSRTPTGPEDVAEPAGDAVLFRSSPVWVFLIVLLVGVPVMALTRLLLELADGADAGWPQIGDALGDALLFGFLPAALAAALVRRGRTWVRVSSGGVEIAAHGGDPVLIDWSEVVAARVRRRWLWAVLEVVPVDPDTVRRVEPGQDPPRLRDTESGTALAVEVGGLRPGPARLRAEIARRVPARDG